LSAVDELLDTNCSLLELAIVDLLKGIQPHLHRSRSLVKLSTVNECGWGAVDTVAGRKFKKVARRSIDVIG